jgi:hypothetical protein
MAIQRINPDDIEVFTLTTNPPRTFNSSSLGVISGTLHVFARRSPFEKEVHPLSMFSGSFVDRDLDGIRNTIAQSTASNKADLLQTYMQNVNSQSVSLRKQQTVEVIRFEPSARFSSNSVRKTVVINNLMPYYRSVYPEAHFAFTNYHSLNFLTGSGLPSDTGLIYADPDRQYAITGAFSFDFWINPRYKNDFAGADFKAGTIFHRSSSYALSLISGSSRDINGYVDGFRLVLQLSHSAEVSPSLATSGTGSHSLIFVSDDNALRRNTWHHVTVRWGTTTINQGSGSFLVDEVEKGTFVISSSLIDYHDENCLLIGNFFEGSSNPLFFTNEVAERDGLTELIPGTGTAPTNYGLNHGLNAEVHELKLYSRFLNDTEVGFLQTQGPVSGTDYLHNELQFYLPPFYTKESPERTFHLGYGGMVATPFFEVDGTSTAPIDVDASFGCAGHYLNLENFVRDFATGTYARLFHLTASVLTGTAPVPTSFNGYLYATGSNLKRHMTLLPNDNGNFFPNFSFMIPNPSDYAVAGIPFSVTQSFRAPFKVDPSQFVNDNGTTSPGFVTLRNLLPMSLFQTQAQEETGSLALALNGVSPEDLSAEPSDRGRYTVLQRTGDNSCNQVVFFDVSNLYYGLQIEPGTVVLRDTNTTGSLGKMELTLIDDGEGNIYRSNTSGSSPDWASVGNVFYNEGIILLKHPSLFFFGTDNFELSFKGKQNTHILTYNLFKRPLMTVSSSNPNYLPVSASTDANDTDKRFVYITGINLHDDNLNVITRTSLAQPIVARTGDKFLFKVRMDF